MAGFTQNGHGCHGGMRHQWPHSRGPRGENFSAQKENAKEGGEAATWVGISAQIRPLKDMTQGWSQAICALSGRDPMGQKGLLGSGRKAWSPITQLNAQRQKVKIKR